MSETQVVETTRTYYNSTDADEFYFNVWGGEDIHVGLYKDDTEPIRDASERTVAQMLSRLPELDANTRILDVGAGYGGAARQIVKKHGCHLTCLNLSEVQNDRNRQRNEEVGLSDKIKVVDGSFEDIPEPDESFDHVWCEDSLLHSADRKKVLEEVYRVLKPGGIFIFTDPMEKDGIEDKSALQPVYDRIHLDSLASFGFYQRVAPQVGFKDVKITDLSEYLPMHYGRVREELTRRYDEIVQLGSKEYVDRMLKGLGHWVEAGKQGLLTWGIIEMTK